MAPLYSNIIHFPLIIYCVRKTSYNIQYCWRCLRFIHTNSGTIFYIYMSEYNTHPYIHRFLRKLIKKRPENVYVSMYNSVTPNYIWINVHFIVLWHKGGFCNGGITKHADFVLITCPPILLRQ